MLAGEGASWEAVPDVSDVSSAPPFEVESLANRFPGSAGKLRLPQMFEQYQHFRPTDVPLLFVLPCGLMTPTPRT